MKLAAVFLLVGLANGQSSIYGTSVCWPTTCKSYTDCYDSIHSYQGFCCGGKCTDLYAASLNPVFVGGSCTNALSLLMGTSSTCNFCDWIATCGSNNVCQAKMPNGCACTVAQESLCISDNCATGISGSYVCIGYSSNLHVGATCYANSECETGVCGSNNKCTGIAAGGSCSSFSNECAAGLSCRYNSSLFGYYCSPLCSQGTASCCSTNADCASGLYCYYYNSTCLPTLAAGADCAGYYQSGACGAGLACGCGSATSCTTQTCVTAGSVADGALCVGSGSLACKPSSWCATINNTYYTYVCIGNASIASGSPCAASLSGYANPGAQCMAPANACSDVTNSGQTTCHVGGSVAAGGQCDYYYANGDCASGSTCAFNSSDYNYHCYAPIAAGGNCTSGLACVTGATCYNPSTYATSCYSLSYGCTCNNYVADGSACSSAVQCKPTSKCTSGTCQALEGVACTKQSDCGTSYSGWDCTCAKKCHYTAAAPTPNVYVDPCQAQENAANAVYPNFESAGYIYGSTYATGWATYTGPFLGSINDTTVVSKILQYICCSTCVTGTPRFEAPPGGWQGDCSTYTLKAIPSTCAATTGNVALLNCFKSGASQIAMSLSAIAAVVFVAVF